MGHSVDGMFLLNQKEGSRTARVHHLLENSDLKEYICLQQLLFSVIENVHAWFCKAMDEIAVYS